MYVQANANATDRNVAAAARGKLHDLAKGDWHKENDPTMQKLDTDLRLSWDAIQEGKEDPVDIAAQNAMAEASSAQRSRSKAGNGLAVSFAQ